MSDVLDRICKDKLAHIAARKRSRRLSTVEESARSAVPTRGFYQSLASEAMAGRFALICEIKKASPSRGLIRENFDPPALARAYKEGGATCISVLTDEPYFQGCDEDLVAARDATELPYLRKDFMLDPYQIFESRSLGADCILLIMAALSDQQAAELEAAAISLGMDVLVEVHDAAELDRALKLKSKLIGINNRDLKTLKVNLKTTVELAPRVPEGRLVVSESGLYSGEDLARMHHAGAAAFLVGESLMRQNDVVAATCALLAHQPVGSASSHA